MEHLEGLTLAAVLGQSPQPLPLHLHLQVLAKVLAGLHAAHELCDEGGAPVGLIHRDISPHNVFVLYDGQVKVLDFGIAKATGISVETRNGDIKGKVHYMAPEQAALEPLDRRVDIFTAGLMLWEALAGRRVWAHMAEAEIVSQLVQKRIPALPREAGVPPALASVCQRALGPRPYDRYATADDFRRDLLQAAGSLPAGGAADDDDLVAFLSQNFRAARDNSRQMIEAHIQAAIAFSTPVAEKPSAVMSTSFFRMPRPGTPTLTRPRGRGDGVPAAMPAAESRGLPLPPIPPPTSKPATVRASGRRPPALAAAIGVAVGALILAGALMFARGRNGDGAGPLGGRVFGNGHAAPDRDDVRCGAGFKPCGGRCVSIDEPGYGCGAASCLPCRTENATARCNNQHQCDIAVCYHDWDDCDGDAANGCESNVRTDPDHCGGCAHRCPELPHAQRGCGDQCTIWRCAPGFRDCNGADDDGCETNVASDPASCGRCGHSCRPGQKCRRGECSP